MRHTTLLVAVVAVSLLASAAAYALDRTPNMVLLETRLVETSGWGEPEYPLTMLGEFRAWESADDRTWAVGLQQQIEDDADLEAWFSSMRTEGEDPIAGAVRRSRWEALSVSFVQQLTNPAASTKVAVAPMVDLATRRATGTNTATGSYAPADPVTIGGALMVQGQMGATTWTIQPKVIFFDEEIPNSIGGITEGFGTTVTVGLGVKRPLFGGEFIGDVAGCVSGHNVIDEDTNEVDRAIVWGAGWRKHFGSSEQTSLAVFATNAAGPSMAKSVIAAPGNTVGIGACVTHTFH